jgi:hypothetical protein
VLSPAAEALSHSNVKETTDANHKGFGVAFVLLLAGAMAFAQEATTGSIEGPIVDAQGLAMPASR